MRPEKQFTFGAREFIAFLHDLVIHFFQQARHGGEHMRLHFFQVVGNGLETFRIINRNTPEQVEISDHPLKYMIER